MTLKKSDPNLQSLPTKGKSASKKPTTMAELMAATGYQIPTLRRGQEVSGKILSITPQEVLIDIGAKSEGIVFGRELASVRDVVKTLKVQDTIEAAVVYPENDAGQVVLSLRKLSGEKRWSELANKKTNNQTIEVVALEVNRGGVICDYLGLRGFLPASQLASGARDLIGKSLEVQVIEVDRAGNRLIFTQKREDEKDLKEIAKLLKKVEIGEKYPGVVSAVLPFGLFVEIEVDSGNRLSVLSSRLSDKSSSVSQSVSQVTRSASESRRAKGQRDKVTESIKGLETDKPTTDQPIPENRQQKTDNRTKLEGLVHISEIAWEKVEDPSKLYKVGDAVEVAVIGRDEKTGRLNLSLKHLASDPFAEISARFARDQQVKGQVARVTSYGVFVTLEGGVEGLVPIAKVPPDESWDVGKTVECTIESIDAAARRIALAPVSREKPILYR